MPNKLDGGQSAGNEEWIALIRKPPQDTGFTASISSHRDN
ncbi:hypothetical protein J2S21_004416 [Peribacillus cavernae]|nr:hypothetical protein [Peribacillus cavernae]